MKTKIVSMVVLGLMQFWPLGLFAQQKEIVITNNVRYRDGESKAWVLDMAMPKEAAKGLRPAIIIIHGGGWSAGDKTDAVYVNLMKDYAQQGYVTFNINYRLMQEAQPPACLEDVKCAVRWVKAHAKDYGVDPQRIGSFGHSAGGHLSLMLGVSADNKELEGDGPWKEFDSSVACAVGGAPPTELGNPNISFGQHTEWWPIGYIKKCDTPLLLLQGAQDPIVKPNLTEDFVNKMRKQGNKTEFIKVDGQHNVSFDYALEFTRPAMDAFFAKHLKMDVPSIHIDQMKVPEGGGSGPYKAIAVKEKTLPNFVVYHPVNMAETVKKEGKLPLMVFGNGGCMDTSIGYENMLTEFASHGYVVIAIGEMQVYQFDRKEQSSESVLLRDAMDWMEAQCKDKSSEYYGMVDMDKVAAGGHSCGGAQVMFNAADKRLKTYLIFNAGMGTFEMAGASGAKNIPQLHGPIIYLIGGPSDVAYDNAKIDYEAIKNVFVVNADFPAAGHGGTYNQKNGGTFAQMALRWLDWQLKGQTDKSDVFLKQNLVDFPGWSIKIKNENKLK